MESDKQQNATAKVEKHEQDLKPERKSINWIQYHHKYETNSRQHFPLTLTFAVHKPPQMGKSIHKNAHTFLITTITKKKTTINCVVILYQTLTKAITSVCTNSLIQ